MLGAAWFRKRILIGIAMALYGLSIFNLHYWGFGFPFILGGAWYLVRAYRLSEKLKHARADQPGSAAAAPPRPARAFEALHPSGSTDPAGAQAQAGQGTRSRLNRPGRSGGPGGHGASVHRTTRRRCNASRDRHLPFPSRAFVSVHTLVTRM